MDALDDSTVRFIINDAIVERGTPYIFGGAVSTVGNALTIVPGKTPCLRCLWPDPAQIAGHASASQVGVLSTAAVVVAAVQTTEALKLLCGRSQDLFQGMLVFDLWNTGFHTAPVARDPNCMCAAAAKIDHKEAPRTWTP
jgi:adenylyltransferase/sulfurtransferase